MTLVRFQNTIQSFDDESVVVKIKTYNWVFFRATFVFVKCIKRHLSPTVQCLPREMPKIKIECIVYRLIFLLKRLAQFFYVLLIMLFINSMRSHVASFESFNLLIHWSSGQSFEYKFKHFSSIMKYENRYKL